MAALRIYLDAFGLSLDAENGPPLSRRSAAATHARASSLPHPTEVLLEDSCCALSAAQKTSSANYVITGDKDLPAMADRCPIVDPAQFWAAHAGV